MYDGSVAYRLEIVTEVRDWLHQLRRTDRASAILVGQAITALLERDRALAGRWSTGSKAPRYTT